MDYRVYRLSLKEWILDGALGLGVCGLAAYTFYRSGAVFILLSPLGAAYPLYRRRERKKERLRQLGLQFKEGILVLASFLSAGYSLENGLAMSIQELELLYGSRSMIVREFMLLCTGVRMNRPAEQLLMDFGARSGLEDVDNFAQVFGAARRSGGDLVEIINYTSGIIRDKVQVQEEIHTITASKVFEQKIMNGIPFLIVLYIDLSSPGFFHVMYGTLTGRLVMTLCLGLYAGAMALSERILDIEI
ncbi:MAG: type II secretion system F family protein [Clostridium sp.]|nr:type II secretion system F family protein [Clostridium sp.]